MIRQRSDRRQGQRIRVLTLAQGARVIQTVLMGQADHSRLDEVQHTRHFALTMKDVLRGTSRGTRAVLDQAVTRMTQVQGNQNVRT